MIEETIRQIEARLNAATKLTPEMRAELLALVAKLRAEAASLPARETIVSTDPLAEGTEVKTLQDDVDRLQNSVQEFEESHPRLVQLANHLASTLAGLGI
jgi:hypothetical protein